MDAEADAEPVVGMTGARFGGAGRARGRSRRTVQPAAVVEPGSSEPAAAVGARFAGAPPSEVPAEPVVEPEGPAVGATGARFAGAARPSRPAREAADLLPQPIVVRLATSPPLPGTEPEPASGPDPTVAVRPYVLTRGRTRARMELAVETLVSTVPSPHRQDSGPEQAEVTRLCAQTRSVAEVAALMRVPLGVVRVLIGDLATAGLVRVHVAASASPDLALLERVLSGLRRL
ncbi:DUF742 domain-containing protein [Pseudonocardia sp. TRM90224]|uniref:DUF742 domain-containing protein n=1 Tax=Pseudonocardia sp. TRM90224 TaxID=2812678 RepID=UPI001E40C45D|nr:DUF742 domain-containing protein [Pseudonocardia sp. TRM90224]